MTNNPLVAETIRRISAWLVASTCLGFFVTADARTQEAPVSTARGMVYHDGNANRRHDEGEAPLAGVGVSNGREIVSTDASGRYEISLPDPGVLFVIKPSGWRTAFSDDQLPQFYYIHKSQGSPPLKYAGSKPTGDLPAAINFPLYPQSEPDTLQMLLFGDTQARDLKEVGYIGNDVITELIGTTASFGVTLGDIVFDDLSLYPAHNQVVGQLKIPWYNVIGNHDLNYDATHRRFANETYESVFGPSYYSFNVGNVHFIVLDNCDWIVATEKEPAHYAPVLGKDQLEFVRNDLQRIPESQMVILMMHIPISDVLDREELFRMIESRPLCLSISGHTHTHEHRYLNSAHGWKGPAPHHHIVNVTACGAWWTGQLDERGIPHALMTDGAPNGYSILTIEGDKYRLDFKAAGRDEDYQMQISTQGALQAGALDQTKLWANVFNGSEFTQVAYQIDDSGPWVAMTRELTVDPLYQQMYDRESKIVPEVQPKLAKPGICAHLWAAPLSADLAAGVHRIQVQAVDPDGRTYRGHHVVRIE